MRIMLICHCPPGMRQKVKLKGYTQFLVLPARDKQRIRGSFSWGIDSHPVGTVLHKIATRYATEPFARCLKHWSLAKRATLEYTFFNALTLTLVFWIRYEGCWTGRYSCRAAVISAPLSHKCVAEILDIPCQYIQVILKYALLPFHRPYWQTPPYPSTLPSLYFSPSNQPPPGNYLREKEGGLKEGILVAWGLPGVYKLFNLFIVILYC